MMIATTLINEFAVKNTMYEDCILNKKQKCFMTNDDTLLTNNHQIKQMFVNYNNKNNENNLQFLVTGLKNNQLALEIHNNTILNSKIKTKIISILLDTNKNINKELSIINDQLNTTYNKHQIEYLLKIHNKRYKIKNGLSTIKFEDLGIENNSNEDDENEELEIANLKRIKTKYNQYIHLQTLKNELLEIKQKLLLTNQKQEYLFQNDLQTSELTTPSITNYLQQLKKDTIDKLILLKQLHNQLTKTTNQSETDKISLQIIILSKQITNFNQNYHKSDSFEIGGLIQFTINEISYYGIIIDIQNNQFTVNYIDEHDELKNTVLSKQNVQAGISNSTYLSFYNELQMNSTQNMNDNKFKKQKQNEDEDDILSDNSDNSNNSDNSDNSNNSNNSNNSEITEIKKSLITEKTIEYEIKHEDVSTLDYQKLLTIQLQTKKEIIDKIKDTCSKNQNKQISEDYFKKLLQPILNFQNNLEWKYLYEFWIKKIILTFSNNKNKINLQQDKTLTSIIKDKTNVFDIILTDYEFDDEKFQFQTELPISTSTTPYKPIQLRTKTTKQQPSQRTIMSMYQDYRNNKQEETELFSQQRQEQRERYYNLGLTGLQNLGNTCFMNSTIQCLYSCQEFVDILLRQLSQNESLFPMGFTKLVKTMKEETQNTNKINQYLHTVRKYFKQQFQVGAQHDSKEILSYILQDITERINSNLTLTNDRDRELQNLGALNLEEGQNILVLQENLTKMNQWIHVIEQNIINKLFTCFTVSTNTSDLHEDYENYTKIQFNKNNRLLITIPQQLHNETTNIQNLLQIMCSIQTLLPQNYVNSEHFNNKIYNKRTETLWKTGNYLILPIHARMMIIDNQEIRNMTKINTPKNLDITPYIHDTSPQKNQQNLNNYELITISWHGGGSKNGGHYISWSKHNQEWFSFNDNNPVKKIENPYTIENGIEIIKNTLGSSWVINYVIYERVQQQQQSQQPQIQEIIDDDNNDNNKDNNNDDNNDDNNDVKNIQQTGKGFDINTNYTNNSMATSKLINDNLFNDNLSLYEF